MLPKADIVIVMGNLGAELRSYNTLLGHLIRKDGLGDSDENGGRSVDFSGLHRLVIGATLVNRACPHVSWGLTGR